jgi:DNA polymerase
LARANGHIFITGNTGRLSGGGGLNLQNLPRGGAIRRALVAPKGKTLVVSDSAQIEARVVAWLAGQHDLVQSFAQKRDVYCEFASEVYGKPITKADKEARFLGKVCILGLGYSMGHVRFRESLALGLGGMKLQITEAEAKRIVDIYRNKNHRITALWNRCSTALSRMLSGMEMDIAPEVLPSLVATRDGIRLPNGMMIRYPALQESGEGVGYVYAAAPRAFQEATKAKILGQSPDPAKMTRIYGGKVVENIVQALARIVVTEQMLEISRRYKIALQVHDEVVVVCDQDEAEECKAYVEAVMSKPPAWAPYLPVACEADYGTSYGEVK